MTAGVFPQAVLPSEWHGHRRFEAHATDRAGLLTDPPWGRRIESYDAARRLAGGAR